MDYRQLRVLESVLRKIDDASLARDRQLEQALLKVIRERNVEGQLSRVQTHKEILSQFYQAASAYSNLIIFAGYAGFFGIWQFVRDDLTSQQSFAVAFLISLSLILFAGFEVFKMIDHAIFFKSLARVVKTIPEQDQLVAWSASADEFQVRQAAVWVWFLVPTVLSGFGAGFYLLWLFVRSLWAGI